MCHYLITLAVIRVTGLSTALLKKCGNVLNRCPMDSESNGTTMSKGLRFWNKLQRCVIFCLLSVQTMFCDYFHYYYLFNHRVFMYTGGNTYLIPSWSLHKNKCFFFFFFQFTVVFFNNKRLNINQKSRKTHHIKVINWFACLWISLR